MTSAERFAAFALAAPIVIGSVWLDGNYDPPTLELHLSTGAYVRVSYDDSYHHRLLWWSPDATTDFVSCTVERTGLSADVLASFEADAERAVRDWAAQLEAERGNAPDMDWGRP